MQCKNLFNFGNFDTELTAKTEATAIVLQNQLEDRRDFNQYGFLHSGLSKLISTVYCYLRGLTGDVNADRSYKNR